MTKISVFPGQGSQKKGMGAELFREFPEMTALADAELGYSMERLCLEDPNDQLDRTEFTQPALYFVNSLSHLKQLKETGRAPDFVAGHSLGEYNALFAAGAFDFSVGLKLVKKRGELMSRASHGGMAAVIGLSLAKIEEVLQTAGYDNLNVANLNTPQQIVISGAHDAIVDAKEDFENAGAKLYVPLKVSGAFHTPFMRSAADEFSNFLEQFEFSPLKIPVIANVDALPYQQDQIKENLAKQITHSVRWSESIQWLLRQEEPEFQEIGPGRVLTGLIAKIKRSI
jgi:trans-AT polyketide synthase/acyltransferase/oxidoreductase domain-containing protein